jgi:hypothetical protein
VNRDEAKKAEIQLKKDTEENGKRDKATKEKLRLDEDTDSNDDQRNKILSVQKLVK